MKELEKIKNDPTELLYFICEDEETKNPSTKTLKNVYQKVSEIFIKDDECEYINVIL